jgi:hypothetical protein
LFLSLPFHRYHHLPINVPLLWLEHSPSLLIEIDEEDGHKPTHELSTYWWLTTANAVEAGIND